MWNGRRLPVRLARFLRLHPANIAQKTEVMLEHFNAVTRHRIGGHAKGNGPDRFPPGGGTL